MRKCLPVLSFILLMACSQSKVPSGILPPEKMKPLLFDMMRADELVTGYVLRDTSLKAKQEHQKMYEQVFAIHKTSKTEFYKSLKFYQQHPNINKVLFDSLLSFANRKKEKLARERQPVNVE